jgi:hypothetical protein
MNQDPLPARRPLFAIFLGGFIAATLDLTYACITNGQYGKSPLWVFQSVATGWLGADAFSGGAMAGAVGFSSHYAILFVAAALYFAASRKAPALSRQAVACGALFGVAVYLFMNFVVLPLSAFPYKLSYPPLRLIEGFFTHALFVGVPIALCIRRWAPPRAGAA